MSSNNNLLNILLPNENKVLKDVLKDADAKTLESLNKGTTTVGDILKNLFTDLKTGDKNLSTIENLLKNSNIFKDLGNFSKNINNLLKQLDDPSLQKYKPLLENFLKDIINLDSNSLKELINRSGVFLEAKALEQTKGNTNIPKNLETLLNQIKNVLKDIPTLESKNLSTLIDKMLQNNSTNNTAQQLGNDLKTLISGLQQLSKGLNNSQLTNLLTLTNNLKNISLDGQLIESKLENFKPSSQNTTAQVNQNLTNMQNINSNQNLPNTQNTNQNLASLENTNTNQTLLQNKENVLSKTLDTLFQLRSEIQSNNNIQNKESLLKQIDTLIQTKDLFTKDTSQIEVKNLLNQLTAQIDNKNLTNINGNIEKLVGMLKNQSDEITSLENKVLQNQNIQVEKATLTKDIQQTILNLRNELSNIPNSDNKAINQIIDRLLNIQNIFSKIEIPIDVKNTMQNNLPNNFQSNFASNINNLIVNLKESIVNLSSNPESLNLHNTIFKNIEKLENISHNILQQMQLPDKNLSQNNLQNDIKTVLLQMQTELQTKSDASSQELLKNVDRLITQVEYHQLLSITSNSNNVYLPFIWDMLDDGTISMKKINEDKFFCEINLSLKELGQTQLLLALYDKNKIDITVYVSKEYFKKTFRENLTKLKQALNSVNLVPTNINIIDMKKDKEQENQKINSNPYARNQDLDTGFNIRV
ncbi:hypothetical protein [Halarcobacter sp.]|uniref:hypothetical protein n=1 Tax=Halarcobacter sp. TaxID=2321133 RepID=UPI002AAB21E3|nr:hypothetical protein [Halarcobacter sp.]